MACLIGLLIGFSATAMPAFASDFFFANPFSADHVEGLGALPLRATNTKAAVRRPGENLPVGWTENFPHSLSGDPLSQDALSANQTPEHAFVTRWRASPFADEYLERLAATVLDSMKLGRGHATDFLGISFSSPDYIGHAFGPDSLEIEDEYLRLDATIGKLLDDLDRAAGSGNYVVVLTADHGVAPIPQQAQLPGVLCRPRRMHR